MVHRLTEQVANKFNMNLRTHLPKVADLMHDYDLLKEKFIQKKQLDVELFKGNEDSINNTIDAVKSLSFNMNALRVDVDFIQKIFNQDRIAALNR